jgi:hypothetical protein
VPAPLEVRIMKRDSNRTDPVLNEAEISLIVEAGGGRYIGVLKEADEKMEVIVLFISRQTKSTLAIPISRLTAEAVRRRVAESNAAFSKRSMPKQTHCTGTKAEKQ